MSSIRHPRTPSHTPARTHTPSHAHPHSRTRLVTAAATVALAALSLTACGSAKSGDDKSAPANSSTSSFSTKSAASAHKQASADGSSGDAKSAPVAKSAPASASSGKFVTCEGSNTKTVAAPLKRPVNRMLLTVTNTGKKTCFLYGYPAVAFGEAQSVPPVDENTKPQAVVGLRPGESGYAGVNLSATDGSGSNGRTENSLAVYFQGRSGNESVGKGAHPALPAKGVYVDDSIKVTYWQTSMDNAINW
ncbi:DUF4232 domain-containing protein [Streptomyces axinellae]|uniref:DUF4232 domain-containing protein n=1 Tax=Streptomyces axinellae TaxID=552788 RepID=A0ABN3QDD7_9ACTN